MNTKNIVKLVGCGVIGVLIGAIGAHLGYSLFPVLFGAFLAGTGWMIVMDQIIKD